MSQFKFTFTFQAFTFKPITYIIQQSNYKGVQLESIIILYNNWTVVI